MQEVRLVEKQEFSLSVTIKIDNVNEGFGPLYFFGRMNFALCE